MAKLIGRGRYASETYPETGRGGSSAPAVDSRLVPAWFQSYALGSDANTGTDSAHPVQHFAEIKRRWQASQGGGRVALPAILITITALDAAPSALMFADPLARIIDVDQAGGGELRIQGADHSASPLHAGTFATVSAFARTAAAGSILVTDGGVADWQPYVAGIRAGNTTPGIVVAQVAGPATAVCWLRQPSAAPSATGTITVPKAPIDPNAAFPSPGDATILAGDTYAVVALSPVYLGSSATYRTFPTEGPTIYTDPSRLTLYRLHCQGINAGFRVYNNFVLSSESIAQSYVLECMLEGAVTSDNAQLTFINCALDRGPISIVGYLILLAGFSYQGPTFGSGDLSNFNSSSSVDADFAVDGDGYRIASGGAVYFGNASAWNAAAGIYVWTGGEADVFFGTFYGAGLNYVTTVANGARCLIQSPATTRFATDAGGGGASQPFAFEAPGIEETSGFAFDKTVGGGFIGPRLCTLGLLDTAIGGGGFGGSAVEPVIAALVVAS